MMKLFHQQSTVYKEKLQIYVHNLGRQLGSEEGCKQGT